MDTSVNNESSVSFFTNCYEGDWEEVLKTDRLKKMITNCGIDFFERNLIINNVKNRSEVESFAKRAVEENVIDRYYFSGDYETKIFKAFSIKRTDFVLDFHDGYWYSMGPLAAIFLCRSKYMIYFTCDCMIPAGTSPAWINKAIALFESTPSICVANPIWEYNKEKARTESFNEDEEWFYGYGFSDQCFFIETKRFYGDVYNYYHISSEIFPMYGGNPFERMINSYMRSKELTRITNKNIHYTHEKLINPNSDLSKPKFSFKKMIKRKAGFVTRKIRIRIKRIFNL